MKPSSQYDLTSGSPVVGGHAAITVSEVLAQESADSINAGTPGPGVPGLDGTPVPSSALVSGMVVALNSAGNWAPATSPTLGTPSLPICMGLVHSGLEDLTGSMLGEPVVLRGHARCTTGQFNGSSFPFGLPLTVNAGKFELKSDPNSTLQVVGFVGPKGLHEFNGANALDVIFGV